LHRTIISTHYLFHESNILITSDDGHAVQGVTGLFYHLCLRIISQVPGCTAN